MTHEEFAGPVVLFDGVCNLCNGAVQFVLDHERRPELRFAALQSEAARELLGRVDGARARALEDEASSSNEVVTASSSEHNAPKTIVLLEGERVHVRSTAALRIARYLRAPWSWLFVLIIVPRFVRDAIYSWVAQRRYQWFGTTETCRVPTPELRERFLS